MACPLCGDRCTCSFTPIAARGHDSASPSLTYEYDDEYGSEESPTPLKTDTPAAELVSEDFRAATPSAPADDMLFSGPTAPPEDLTFESASRPEEQEDGQRWKQELVSRLENYRARRGSRRPRYNPTMSLDFDRAANRMINSALAEQEMAQSELASSSVGTLEEEAPADAPNEYFGSATDPEWPQVAEPAPIPVTKILEFPRLPTLFDMVPAGNELADSVDKPRILYVPEEVPTSQAPLADIQVSPEERPLLPEVDFPLYIAPVGQRVFAALIDGAIVLAAAAVFMAVVLREVPAPDGKLGYALVAALPAVLWAIYEYLFLVHCAGTPGMQITHLTLASFDSEPIGRRLRRVRAIACMLSSFPLGLGIIWALLDEDTLCWHDRITRTYLTMPEPTYGRDELPTA